MRLHAPDCVRELIATEEAGMDGASRDCNLSTS
jgi:hypothetical protein